MINHCLIGMTDAPDCVIGIQALTWELLESH